MRRGLALVGVAVATAATASASPGDAWKTLRRPLHIPRIEPGSRCPVSRSPRSGPAYPLLSSNAVVRYRFPALQGEPAYGSPWTSVPMAWRVTHGYRGPLLIRGRQLDGTHVLRFGAGQIPGTASWVPRTAATSERTLRSLLRLRVPGCYGFQVDGLTFSHTIVFRAELRGASTLTEVVAGLQAAGLPMRELGEYHSIAFDLLGVKGHEFLAGARAKGPGSSIVLWEFATFQKAQSLVIDRNGLGLTVRLANGSDIGAAIFCRAAPCSSEDNPPARHWFRSGRVLAVYLGDDPTTRRAIGLVLGEQLAGT